VIDCGTTRCGVLAISSAGGGPFASHHITFGGTPIADDDLDTIENGDDNCPGVANPAQANNDGDAMGDVCDADDDNDSFPDGTDACPQVAGTGANGCPALPPSSPAGTVATGQRAAAVKKCKKKKGRARAKCLKKAKKLPV
jgi:hypothetical protein